jgi:HD-GYP domain-containing protein (c-di-GMP phosphodiesterase class II)
MRIFIKDRCIILNLVNYNCNPGDYLFDHALHVCLLCINIATACNYSKKQVLEIGEAGLLADVGMLLLPYEMRFKDNRLNGDEFIDIQKHTMIGITLLEKIEHVPSAVPIAAYQHHERISGSGYNKKRKGHLIHNYAKIVAVADVYHAMCNERAHRKADLAHIGLKKVIKMSKLNLLDRDIVNNFVKYVSLYPIGSFIRLSDERVARVVQANDADVARPIVSVLTDSDENRLKKSDIHQINLSWETALSIVEAIDYPIDSDHLMDGF